MHASGRASLFCARGARWAILACSLGAGKAAAHHGEDPTSALPLWLMMLGALAVAVGWFALRLLRRMRAGPESGASDDHAVR